MTCEEWERALPESVKGDAVWQFFAYRKALFLFDLAWEDCGRLIVDPRGRAVATQMIDSVGSISANIEEGHGRGPGKDRNHFLRISAGSARETKGWLSGPATFCRRRRSSIAWRSSTRQSRCCSPS